MNVKYKLSTHNNIAYVRIKRTNKGVFDKQQLHELCVLFTPCNIKIKFRYIGEHTIY